MQQDYFNNDNKDDLDGEALYKEIHIVEQLLIFLYSDFLLDNTSTIILTNIWRPSSKVTHQIYNLQGVSKNYNNNYFKFNN